MPSEHRLQQFAPTRLILVKDNFAVADAVRALSRPTVFLTGHADEDLLPQHLDRFVRLEKPIDAKQLMGAIRRVLERPAAS